MVRKKRGSRPYSSTSVTVAVTQYRDVTGLLADYGIEVWEFGTHKGRNMAQVRFQLPESGHWVRARLRARVEPGMTEKQIEQEERTVWRALYYWLKSQFEAIEYGLFTPEEAFIGWLELATPDGMTTVAELVLPRLGDMPKLLASGG
jgi:hypothetical protein